MIQLNSVTKTVRSGTEDLTILSDVSIEIPEGQFVALTGASGSGKSTLLGLIAGLDAPTSGRILIDDDDITRMSEDGLAEIRSAKIGFVFQSFHLIPSLTAYENVALVTEIADRPMPADEALAMVGLQDRMGHFPAQLSGGEQQRVAIARAIVKQPEVLLCDEPTGALDSKTGVVVIDALLRTNELLGTTTLVITHNATIQDVAHRVLSFANGQISAERLNETRRPAAELAW